jgi:hypothetical protein
MNPANTTALDTADMIDVGKSPCRFKLQTRARITKVWLVKNKEINQTLRLLADMTEELYHLWSSIDEDSHSPLRILQTAQVAVISNVDT